MGTVRSGPPTALVLALQETFGIHEFVETGTNLGNTSAWAAQHFEKIYTIEAEPTLVAKAKALNQKFGNIEYSIGESPAQLPSILEKLKGPAIFWLDAHYSGEGTAGEEFECPLLEEIEAINNSPHEHYLLIDDARLFLCAPPSPHRVSDWPTLAEIIPALLHHPKSKIAIFQDVISCVPEKADRIINDYVRALGVWS